jgi:hypothetical protein
MPILVKNEYLMGHDKVCAHLHYATRTALGVKMTDSARASRKETKIQKFMYTDTTNVEHEMYNYTNYNWSHQKNNKRFKKKILETIPGKHPTDTLNKTATPETSHTICKVLQSETEA